MHAGDDAMHLVTATPVTWNAAAVASSPSFTIYALR